MGFGIHLRRLWALRSLRGALVLVAALLSVPTIATAQGGSSHASLSHAATAITVEGNRRIEPDTIRSYFRADASGRIDALAADAALKALFDTGLFRDVRIRREGGRLIVTVVENPVINRVAVEGNKSVKDDQLRTELQSKAGGPLSRPKVQADVIRITDLLHHNGRFNVQVEPKTVELPNGRVDLVFEITEG